jgi:RNA polymerase sigma factor (TIGR02999 family)
VQSGSVRLSFFSIQFDKMPVALSAETIGLLMAKFRHGDREAAGELVELCYPELRRLAAARMRTERTEHTWQATALINELYLELVKVRSLNGGSGSDEEEKAAFLGFAGHLMRRLLLHHSRPLYRRVERVEFQDGFAGSDKGIAALGEVEELLSRLSEINPKFRTVVEMRVFEGRTSDEIAQGLGCSRRTVASYWNFAKRWLQKEWAGASDSDG